MRQARPALLTLAAILLGWFGWWLGGAVAALLGLGDLAWPAHGLGALAALTFGDWAQARFPLADHGGRT